ncbi:NUDIX hydrolase [Natronomonas salina]|uniref:NUDIX hydrolase n=1 Tax=Natronomonas salina TaxID=1710540 RepID=UPI0015B73E21|nr:NUDIX hydrolase [Natronomonas salina]QLD90760.1 NUDIX hydrolase [Natronomonas salina]
MDDSEDDDTTDALAWETLDSEIDYSCPGFDVVRDDVRLPNGTETDFHYVSEPPSVVILPFTTDGDVVVIEEWRQAVDRVNYGLPAGGLEADDNDLLAAAHRELAEETGYEAEGIEQLATYEPSNGLFDSVFHYVVARGCTPTAEQDLDHNESIRVDTTTFPDLREQAVTGDLRDGRSALAILQYAQQED